MKSVPPNNKIGYEYSNSIYLRGGRDFKPRQLYKQGDNKLRYDPRICSRRDRSTFVSLSGQLVQLTVSARLDWRLYCFYLQAPRGQKRGLNCR